MDNFELEDGYKPNFGLYTMSYKNEKASVPFERLWRTL